MNTEFLMGNEAIALGALAAGVAVVTGYPGTPSSEIVETIAERAADGEPVHVEWSVNEKVALEVAAGAAYAGVRSMVTMKQVGLNVASDPLMSLAYIGVKGGMVVVAADDPGPISSQTEQDTRLFAEYAKLPVFDPSSPEEAYEMIGDAFAYSEKYGTPVLFRPTTRVCHGNAPVEVRAVPPRPPAPGFTKGAEWVIFPRLSYENHVRMEERLPRMGEDFSGYRFNGITGSGRLAVATGGVSYAYVREALSSLGVECRLLKVATPNPFPEPLALEFLDGVEQVLVVEELDPVIEHRLLRLAGDRHLPVTVLGKGSGHMPRAGEYTVSGVRAALAAFLGASRAQPAPAREPAPEPPARPPVLCAGCPHRASFLAVKEAMRGKKAVFSGDIGCYTLGNAKPLDMVDTCLCMGAGVTIAQGLHRVEPDTTNFAFIGDSTFFHTGIPGVINAVYNGADIVLVVLDNSTTAMTGGQPHPGIGKNARGEVAAVIDIAEVLRAVGVQHVETCDPLRQAEARAAVRRAVDVAGVSAVVFKSPCITVAPRGPAYVVDAERCTACETCIRRLGCPAITSTDAGISIDASLCYGCGVCEDVCPADAIEEAR